MLALLVLILACAVSFGAASDVLEISLSPEAPSDDAASRYTYATQHTRLQPHEELPLKLAADLALESDKPLCGFIEVGETDSKVWFVADTSDKEGRYDVLYCGSDLDGTITASERLVSQEPEERSSRNAFGDIAVRAESPDGSKLEVSFQPQLRVYTTPDDQPFAYVGLVPKTRLWGKTALNGSDFAVCLIDADCNGLIAAGSEDTVAFYPEVSLGRPTHPLDYAKVRASLPTALSGALYVEGKLYTASLDAACSNLTLSPSIASTVSLRFEFRQEGIDAESGDAVIGRLVKQDLTDTLTSSRVFAEAWMRVPKSGGLVEADRSFTLEALPLVVEGAGAGWSTTVSTADPLPLSESANVIAYSGIESFSVEPGIPDQPIMVGSAPRFGVVARGSAGERYPRFSKRAVTEQGVEYWASEPPKAKVTRSDGEIIYSGPMTYT